MDQNLVAQQQFINPVAAAYDPQGNFYYADTDRVWRLNADGSDTLVAQIPGSQANISAIAVDSNQRLYIADSGNAVTWKSTGIGVLTALPQPEGTRASAGLWPIHLAIGKDDTLYVDDMGPPQIFSYPPDGDAPSIVLAAPKAWPQQQSSPSTPAGLAVLGSKLFIADVGAPDILQEDLTTGAITTVIPSGSRPSPNGAVAVKSDGTLFFTAPYQIFQLTPGAATPQLYAGSLNNAQPSTEAGPALTITLDASLIAVNPINGDLALSDFYAEMARVIRASSQNLEPVAGERISPATAVRRF